MSPDSGFRIQDSGFRVEIILPTSDMCPSKTVALEGGTLSEKGSTSSSMG